MDAKDKYDALVSAIMRKKLDLECHRHGFCSDFEADWASGEESLVDSLVDVIEKLESEEQ
jgi:hypothetical protein